MTGNKFNNICSGRSRTSMNCCVPLCSSMSRRRNEQRKQELPNDQCAAKPGNLKNTAWRACLSKSPKRTQKIDRGAFHQICANSLLISKQSILAFAPMKWQRSAFCVLAADPHLIPSSACSLMAHVLPLQHVDFPRMRRSPSHLSEGKSLFFYTRKDGPFQRLPPTCKPLATRPTIFCIASPPRDTQDLMINPVLRITRLGK